MLILSGQSVAAEPARVLQQLGQTFELRIYSRDVQFPVHTTGGVVYAQNPSERAIARYADLLNDEFRIYPRDLVKQTRLQRIILCEDLSYNGQRRSALPAWEHDTLFLDVSRGDADYQRSVLHHEFFHIIDLRDDGEVYRDATWEALNPPQFAYGSGGRSVQHIASTSILTDRFYGFINHYSTTGVEEDKAEVFANLIVNPMYLKSRTQSDAVLQAKVELLKRDLVRFCPDINHEFWRTTEFYRKSFSMNPTRAD